MAEKETKCRSCGAAILWTTTGRGKKMPVDVQPVAGGNVYLEEKLDPETGQIKLYSSVLREGASIDGKETYSSHFETCPDATKHRKDREERYTQQHRAKEVPAMPGKISEDYFVRRGNQQFVRFNGLLMAAHATEDLEGIETEYLGWGNGKYQFKATVTIGGRTFTGHGDAGEENVSAQILPHAYRMAETRAIARALRFALGVDVAAIEELLEGEPAAEVTPATKPYTPPAHEDEEIDASDEMEAAMAEHDPNEEDQDAVKNDIINLINSAPANKRDILPTIDDAMEYAGRSLDYARATRKRVNDILRGGRESA